MNKYKEKAAKHRELIKAREESPEGRDAWEWFHSAVEQCRSLERKYNIPLWAAILVNGKIETIPDEELPREYVAAVKNWNEARLARDKIYSV